MSLAAPAAVRFRILETNTGPFQVLAHADGTFSTGWLDLNTCTPPNAEHDPHLLPVLSDRLQRYFAGETVDFAEFELPEGPPFHRACWDAARLIPRGSCWTYAHLARKAGRPSAHRAAGQAMRRNPVPIIVPCHRVVASSGRFGGFAGETKTDEIALHTKRTLLHMEGLPIEGEMVQCIP